MPFPSTFSELASANYHFSCYGSCTRCRAHIEWWITPRGKRIALNYRKSRASAVVPHCLTCTVSNNEHKPVLKERAKWPNAEQFRSQKAGVR